MFHEYDEETLELGRMIYNDRATKPKCKCADELMYEEYVRGDSCSKCKFERLKNKGEKE